MVDVSRTIELEDFHRRVRRVCPKGIPWYQWAWCSWRWGFLTTATKEGKMVQTCSNYLWEYQWERWWTMMINIDYAGQKFGQPFQPQTKQLGSSKWVTENHDSSGVVPGGIEYVTLARLRQGRDCADQARGPPVRSIMIMFYLCNTTCTKCISYHTIPYHTIPYHIISYHIVSCHIIIPYNIISYHIISYHIVPHHII